MYVYKAERDAGLAEKLALPVVIASRVEKADPAALPAGGDAARAKKLAQKSGRAVGSVGDEDLKWFKSLLVSSGFNDNDHYFGVAELWAARKTPEDKPINVDHVQHDIVGHMIASYVVAADGVTVVPDDTAPDELPDEIHLVDPGVLYARWEDEKLQERFDLLWAEVEKGERSVSMEVWFRTFDYAAEKADGSVEIIPRNKTTAHLTKSLRIFGGSGKLDGRRLGMALRGLTFAGKGLVTDPANPRSEVLETAGKNIPEKTEPAAAAGYVSSEPPKGTTMADANTQVKPADEVDYKAKASELQTLVAALQTQVDEGKAKLAEKDAALKAASDELAALKASSQKAARLDEIHTKLGFGKDDEGRKKAEAFLTPIASLSDENFAAVLANQEGLKPAPVKPVEPKPLGEIVPAKADAAQLETLKIDPKPDLAAPAPAGKEDEVLKGIASLVRNQHSPKKKVK